MRSTHLEMSCPQSKSISASVAGKTWWLLEGSGKLPGILCLPLRQHLRQFSAQWAHNACSLPTNSISGIRRSKKLLVLTFHFCARRTRERKKINRFVMLLIMFPLLQATYDSVPVSCREHSVFLQHRIKINLNRSLKNCFDKTFRKSLMYKSKTENWKKNI